MVIIKIWGGIGNQLFLYALYRAFLENGRDSRLDTSYYDYFKSHNGYELEKVFDIKSNYATRAESQSLGSIKLDLISRVLRKLFGPKKTHYIQDIYKDFGYNDTILDKDNAYIQGYFQSEKYFTHIEEILRTELVFKIPLDDENQKIADVMNEHNSVSIHVRRGDYLQAKDGLGGVCSIVYYKNAVREIEDKIQNPLFVVFSNDIAWCRENLKLKDCIYVENNSGENSYRDMQLMSLCKHNIIANSSFSWWGAWLNRNPDKIVIAPEKWFNTTKINGQDIVPEKWKKCKVTHGENQ